MMKREYLAAISAIGLLQLLVPCSVVGIKNRDDPFDSRPNDPDSIPSGTSHLPSECQHYSILRNTIPMGKADTPHHRLGPVSSIQECISKCCMYGPSCQYAWMFQDICYSVYCTNEGAELCQPKTVEFDTVFVNMNRLIEPNDEAPPTNKGSSTVLDMESPNEVVEESSTIVSLTSLADNDVAMATIAPSITSSLVINRVATSSAQQQVLSSPVATPPVTTHPPTKAPPSTNNKHLLHNSISVAVNNKVVILPVNRVSVFGSTWPLPIDSESYHYQWTKVSGPAQGDLVGINQKTLHLHNLVEGDYTLSLTVYKDDGNYGMTNVTITVKPEPHISHPPHVVISPQSGTSYTKPVSTVILDASGSTSDNGKEDLSYKWELMGGPLQALNNGNTQWAGPLLKLTDPSEGTYHFKLTVTDKNGLSSVGMTNFTVEAEKDYPPVANAGSAVLIHLPNNEITLSSEGSKDDKGIVKYEWTKVEGKAVDITGTNSPKLHLANLLAGVYQFKLVVTDTIGQSASATVTVDVQEENNQPPLARVSGNADIYYPRTMTVLNGSESTDDYQIISYQWRQVQGPTDIVLNGLDKPVLRVTKLHIEGQSPTVYQFTLEVTDYRNLTNSTTVNVSYYKNEELLPIVNAGDNVVITLPERTAVLNGSLSKDGFGIASYQWSRSGNSPAAGNVVGGSDHSPILTITDLVNGTYNFSLNVTNKKGKSNTDYVILKVLSDPRERYLVEIYLDEIIYTFNQSDLETLKERILLKLGQLYSHVHIQNVQPHGNHILVDFYVTDKHNKMINSSIIYSELIEEGQVFRLGQYHAVAVEEKICHNECSGRGYCDLRTKRCVCSMFWIENPFKANFGKKLSNCDWSLLYVILIGMGVVCLLVIGVWLCLCCCIRRICRRKKALKRRKVKYAILDHKENEGHLQMLPRGNQAKNHSLIVSESETEEEILFESNKRKGDEKRERQSLISKNNSAPSIKVLRNDLRTTEEIKNAKNT